MNDTVALKKDIRNQQDIGIWEGGGYEGKKLKEED
jgi:hypothetical protein